MSKKAVIAVTGGGSGIFEKILTPGGGSSWFLEGIIPYSYEALQAFLGYKPERACSEETARRMAMVAYKRALKYHNDPKEICGVGCTASLALADKTKEREGRKHHFYLSIQRNDITVSFSCLFKYQMGRESEEFHVTEAIRRLISGQATMIGVGYEDLLDVKSKIADDKHKLSEMILFDAKGYKILSSINEFTYPKDIIFPGSFNPIHNGHWNIIEWCNRCLNQKPYLEISINNVDKSSLDYIDIYERVYHIANDPRSSNLKGIIISNAPTFLDKNYRYNSPMFLVGTDTLSRIFDPKYYKNTEDLRNAIDSMKINDCRFYVLDRKGYKVHTNLVEKFGLDRIAYFVPDSEYKDEGYSSSEIRDKESKNAKSSQDLFSTGCVVG